MRLGAMSVTSTFDSSLPRERLLRRHDGRANRTCTHVGCIISVGDATSSAEVRGAAGGYGVTAVNDVDRSSLCGRSAVGNHLWAGEKSCWGIGVDRKHGNAKVIQYVGRLYGLNKRPAA